tara:strand:+ start:157 stop:501 length:345 start_codon:yes stop_codon:yes gene_type:complete
MPISKEELKEIKKLALDYRANCVFTSWDCYDKDPNRWADNLRMIFLPIGLGANIKKEHTFFYCYRNPKHELPKGFNGFPMFDRVNCFTKEKEEKLIEILKTLETKEQKELDKIN